MAAYKALPDAFAKIHRKHLTPTVSTLVMGGISIILYLIMNSISGGNVIPDAVTAIGLYIAFYYGLTAFACVWYYRRNLTSSTRNLFMQGILPGLGGLIMYGAGAWSLWEDWDVAVGEPYTQWTMPGTHWVIGGPFIIALLAAVAGVVCFIFMRVTAPAFFRKETLTRGTPTLVPDK
jgi:amino acid transporter